MTTKTTKLISTLRRITQPLLDPKKKDRDRLVDSYFPHPQEEGWLPLHSPEFPKSQAVDPELETVKNLMQEIHNEPFLCARRERMLEYGESMEVALEEVRNRILQLKLKRLGIRNVHVVSYLKPGGEVGAHKWLLWERNYCSYILDPTFYDEPVLAVL